MMRIEWEDIETNLSTFIRRSKVPGGWIVIATEEVCHNFEDHRGIASGWDWRSSICYVPDPEHKWGKEEAK